MEEINGVLHCWSRAKKEHKLKAGVSILYLLKEESVENLCRRRPDKKLEEFNVDDIEEIYKYIKRCIEEAVAEAWNKKKGENADTN